MSKFIFENSEELKFKDLPPENKLLIIDSIGTAYCSLLWGDRTWNPVGKSATTIDINLVYRVLDKPYTLEDALEDAAAICAKRPSQVTTQENDKYMDIIRKLAESLGGDK